MSEPTTAETLSNLYTLGAVPLPIARLNVEKQLRWVESECATYDAWERWDSDDK